MQEHVSSGVRIMYKIIKGKPHPTFRRSNHDVYELGIAFRTAEAPVGYFPFFDENDFDLSGSVSLKERIMSSWIVDMSSVASPYTLLIQGAHEDIDFLGAGDPNLKDIQREVNQDRLSRAMAAAAGVFVDGVMLTLGGPAIRTLVGQFTKSTIKRFVVSKSLSASVKAVLRKQANFDADKFLKEVK